MALIFTRLLFSTSVNIIFSIKRNCSVEYKTILKDPGLRNGFLSADFRRQGSVQNKVVSCLLREWSKCQEVYFRFPVSRQDTLAGPH